MDETQKSEIQDTQVQTTPPDSTTQVPPSPSAPEPENKEKKKNTLLPLLIVLFLVLIAGGVYISYENGYLDFISEKEEKKAEDNTVKEDEDADTTEEEITETEKEKEVAKEEKYFEGETVKTLKPDGWTVEEYYDGEGTDSLVSGMTYDGFTGLKIKKNGIEKFSMRAVTGIGFEGCRMYYKFKDFNPSHLAYNESMEKEVGENTEIIDHTNSKYSEFEWLGKTFRRIGEIYFYDEQEGNNYFEAPCFTGILVLEGLSFEDSDGYLGESYFYGAKAGTSEADLLVIDSILSSMTLQN